MINNSQWETAIRMAVNSASFTNFSVCGSPPTFLLPAPLVWKVFQAREILLLSIPNCWATLPIQDFWSFYHMQSCTDIFFLAILHVQIDFNLQWISLVVTLALFFFDVCTALADCTHFARLHITRDLLFLIFYTTHLFTEFGVDFAEHKKPFSTIS